MIESQSEPRLAGPFGRVAGLQLSRAVRWTLEISAWTLVMEHHRLSIGYKVIPWTLVITLIKSLVLFSNRSQSQESKWTAVLRLCSL